MEKVFTTTAAGLLTVLTVAGFLPSSRPKRLLGIMNVDFTHSLIRVPLTLAMIYASTETADVKTTRRILTAFGVVYLVVGTVGLADRKVGSALPSGLTGFDLAYHFGTGLVALWLGTRPGRMMKP
jgi:hypothetical protein